MLLSSAFLLQMKSKGAHPLSRCLVQAKPSQLTAYLDLRRKLYCSIKLHHSYLFMTLAQLASDWHHLGHIREFSRLECS